MFKNYIKIAWRKIKADKLFSTLNVLGLSVGLGITLLLFLFVFHERSFDTMYPKKDRIARVLLHTLDGYNETWCNIPSAVAPAMTEDIPEIEKSVRIYHYDFGQPALININNENFVESRFFYADESIVDVFDLHFIQGNPNTVLQDPNTLIISESSARRYFGNANPIGQKISLENLNHYEVAGVFKDFPNHSSINCNIIVPFKSTYFYENPSWGNASFETYCLLAKNIDLNTISNKLDRVLEKNTEEGDEFWYKLSLQEFNKVHLYSADYTDSFNAHIGDIDEVRNLSFLAILILLIA